MRPLAIALLLGVALLASPAAAQLPASCLAAGFYTQNALLTALLPAYTLCPQVGLASGAGAGGGRRCM